MKAIIQQLFISSILFIIIFIPNTLFAENVTLTAAGEYVMGDNDTYTEAKKLALQDAKRILLEKVGTYIESKTEVKDGIVKSDEIKQYTAGIVKVEEVSDERSVLANKASVVKVNVKAIVDPDSLIKQVISFRNRKDVEESAKKTNVENNKLRKEIDQLNQQLRNVTDEKKYQQLNTQRKQILEKIDTNEKGLTTLLLSGEGLYTAVLLDRQKKDENREIVTRFLQALPSAYKITVSKPKVADNGNGTANLKFNVNVELPYSNKLFTQWVSKIDGFSLTELWSIGLWVSPTYCWPNSCFGLMCYEEKCVDTIKFTIRELETKPLILYITLGQQVIRVKLSDWGKDTKRQHLDEDYSYECKFNTYYSKEFSMDIPLSEIKEISQLEAKVSYFEKK